MAGLKFVRQRESGQVCNVDKKFDEATNELVIRVKLDKHYGKSSTGKSYIVACTGGPKTVAGIPGISVNLNVFAKPRLVEEES